MSGQAAPVPLAPLGAFARARLIAEVVTIYARARRHLRSGTLETTLAFVRGLSPRTPEIIDDRRRLGLRLARATVRTLEPLPTDSRCLMRSLVLTGLMTRRGIDVVFVLAVRSAGQFAAHAWVEFEGRPLLEPASEPFERLVEL